MATTTEPSESFQISLEAAELYESAFVPAFFAQWAPVLCDAAGIASGQTVLDVAAERGSSPVLPQTLSRPQARSSAWI